MNQFTDMGGTLRAAEVRNHLTKVRALSLAVLAHGSHHGPDGHFYVLHPFRVLNAVRDKGRDVMIVAVLHAVLELTWVQPGYMRYTLGAPPELVGAIEALTRRPGESQQAVEARALDNPLAGPVWHACMNDCGPDWAAWHPGGRTIQQRDGSLYPDELRLAEPFRAAGRPQLIT